MDNNLQLWDQVRTPDPDYTKSFSRGGGFKGTATNVVYMVREATRLWGPIGGKWGVDIKDERYVDGAPILHDGKEIAKEVIHVIRIELRHPDGVVPGIGQTQFVGKNKNGVFTDEEAPKKSLTDALSKAMSWLGFAADIHLGLWDDNKYVNDVRRQFEEGARGQPDPKPEPVATLDPTQQAEIAKLAKAAKVSGADVLAWVSKRAGYEIANIAAIPLDAYEPLKKSFVKKAKPTTEQTEGAAA